MFGEMEKHIFSILLGASGVVFGYVAKSIVAIIARRLERADEDQRENIKSNTMAIQGLTGAINELKIRLSVIAEKLALIPSLQNEIHEAHARIREMRSQINGTHDN